jgi:uncharacterized protein YdhG (YjbR/CyaY superfamily)
MISKIPAKDVDSYLALQPQHVRIALEKLRQIIKTSAPNAEEIISYGMPAYKFHGMLVYFAAFKNHCSFFPGNASLIEKMKDELKDYTTSKGTIQFTTGKPLPAALVKKIVKARMEENLARKK